MLIEALTIPGLLFARCVNNQLYRLSTTYSYLSKEDALDTLYQEALLMHRQRQFATAEKIQRISLWKDTDADAWLNLGILYYEFERYKSQMLLLSIKFTPENF